MKRLDNPLSTARADMPGPRQLFLRLVERSHGIGDATLRYQAWRAGFDRYPNDAMNRLLAVCDIGLDIRGPAWPPLCAPERPLLMIANHPFGVPDGVAVLALAEQLGRPVKILINTDLLRIPEMERFALPIDFTDTPASRQINAASGREAIMRLKGGDIVVIFPSGGIATAGWALGRAGDLPWKTFVAKLVHKARADVLPLFFPGQNSWRFQAASQISMFWRLSLVLPEALRRIGRDIEVRVGAIIPYEDMSGITDRNDLTAMLRGRVFALRPGDASMDREGRIAAMRTGRAGRTRRKTRHHSAIRLESGAPDPSFRKNPVA